MNPIAAILSPNASETLAAPDEIELDIPGSEPEAAQPSGIIDRARSRPVDRVLATLVTFGPPLAAALTVYLHLTGWARLTWIEITCWLSIHALAVTGVEVGFHRLFTHGSYKATRSVRVALAIMGSMAFQGPVIWWCAVHRKHHRHSDRPADPHSIYIKPDGRTDYNRGILSLARGFLHAHMGWIWVPESTRFVGWGSYVRNLYQDKDLFRIHVQYPYWLALSFLIPTVLGGALHGTWQGAFMGFLWGGFVRVFIMNHLTYWTINSVSHSVGRRPYLTADRSTNSIPLLFAIPTLGQSYHNNHHAFPSAAAMRHEWYEFDLGLIILRCLSWLGLVYDLRVPTEEQKKRKRTKKRRRPRCEAASQPS